MDLHAEIAEEVGTTNTFKPLGSDIAAMFGLLCLNLGGEWISCLQVLPVKVLYSSARAKTLIPVGEIR